MNYGKSNMASPPTCGEATADMGWDASFAYGITYMSWSFGVHLSYICSA